MKRTSTWDTYVQEARKKGDRSIELPLTDDESYLIPYPSRRQGRAIARATAIGDTDALVMALLGDEAGERVKELAEDHPADVLDEFLLDVMRQFGMVSEKDDAADDSPEAEASDAAPAKAKAAPKRRTNGRAAVNPGKSTTSRAKSTRR